MSKEISKDTQQKYLELQMLNSQIQQVQQQIQTFNNQLQELEFLKQSLSEFKDVKKDSEVLVPLSSGMFMKAKLLDTKELMLNVGGNVVVKKTITESVKLIDKQVDEINKYRDEMLETFQKIMIKSKVIETQLEDELKKAQ